MPVPVPYPPPIVPSKVPLDNHHDIELVLFKMHRICKSTDFGNESVGDLCGHIFSIGMACSVLGYLPHPSWPERLVECRIVECRINETPQCSNFLEVLNKVYRLFKSVEAADEATENQAFRCYRLQRKIVKIVDELRPCMRAMREPKDSP